MKNGKLSNSLKELHQYKNNLNLALMSERRKNFFLFLPLLVFSIGLILRKAGATFGPGLILVSGLWLSFSCFLTGIKRIKSIERGYGRLPVPVEMLLGLCLLLILFQQQYWFHGPAFSWISALIFLVVLLYRMLNGEKYIQAIIILRSSWPLWISASLYSLICFLLITGIAMNPRQFHNFYRSTTYEEYLRRQYPTLSTENANHLIDKYRDRSATALAKSDSFYELARRSESEKKNQDALRQYNLAIDLNPDNADAYFHRGFFKLHHLELNNGLAFSALADFSESIRLRPDHALSYFQRGVTLAYLDKKKRVCEDMHRAYSLDSTLDIELYIRKYCPADSAGF